jgi:glycosyltransferase involved in cell wall biosynthesis
VTPDVTVVVPTRDRVELLLHTVRSVQLQHDVAVEVIVVDDGSVDGTSDAVRRLDDPRVRAVTHERPCGVSTARNRGVAEARGRWVAFLDDDDLWSPHKLAAQLHALETDARAWATTGAVSIDDALEVLAGEHPPSPEQIVADLPRYNAVPVGASSVVVARSALARVGGFDPGIRHMADWDMWIRLSRLGLPSVAPRPLVAYRLHATAATMDTAADPAEPLAELEVIAGRYGIPVDRAAVLRWIAWTAMRRGHRWAAVRAYAGAIRRGDVASTARLAVALVHPGVGKQVFFRPFVRRREDDAWLAEARGWLRELAAE